MKKFLIGIISLLSIATIFAESKNLIFKDTYNKIDTLDVTLFSENITIKTVYSDDIIVEVYSNNKRLMPTVDNQGKALVIKSSKKSIRFGEYCNVEIYVPEEYKFKQVEISQSSGSSKIDTLNSENIYLENTSGSLSADSLSADYKLKIQHTSGATKIENLAADEFSISSSSGTLKIGKVNTIDSTIYSTSGAIKVEKMDTESFDIKSTSGALSVENISCDYFSLYSTSGSSNLEFETVPTATSRIRTTSGSVKLYFPSKEGFDLVFSTNSGSYSDLIKGERSSPRGSISSSFFGGGPEIIVSTTSGSLTIEK